VDGDLDRDRPLTVTRTHRARKGDVEVMSLARACAQLANSARFPSRAEAEAALLTGQPVVTYFNVYQLNHP
jgi:hypothetical protein